MRLPIVALTFWQDLWTSQATLNGIAALLVGELLVPEEWVLLQVALEFAEQGGIMAGFEGASLRVFLATTEAHTGLSPWGLRVLS
jgi:hypothetical protein